MYGHPPLRSTVGGMLTCFYSAKHLHSPEQQLTSMAGSFGYVAPEVLKKQGHGKAVDIWSTGIITYVLLCGYSPFRADNTKALIEENTAAKIEFQTRYWNKISDQAKDFIRRLTALDPNDRPTAQEALKDPWLTAEVPVVPEGEEEHDLRIGLREHFSARGKWKSAVHSVRAAHRFSSRTSTKSSGGWMEGESEGEPRSDHGPGENANVTVTAPEDDQEKAESSEPSEAHALKGEEDASSSSPEPEPTPPVQDHAHHEPKALQPPAILVDEPQSTLTPEQQRADEEARKEREECKMPGSFHWHEEERASKPQNDQPTDGAAQTQKQESGDSKEAKHHHHGHWADLLKKLRLS